MQMFRRLIDEGEQEARARGAERVALLWAVRLDSGSGVFEPPPSEKKRRVEWESVRLENPVLGLDVITASGGATRFGPLAGSTWREIPPDTARLELVAEPGATVKGILFGWGYPTFDPTGANR